MTSGPLPPADLHRRSLPIVTLPVGCELFRIHRLGYDPIHFAIDGDTRFNAPADQFGVMYLGRRAEGAFAETFLRNVGRTLVEMSDLRARGLARLRAARELRLVRLHGNGLPPLGATAEVTGTRDYALTRIWALMLWEHPERPDGIAYMARHDNEQPCVALFDRARDAVAVVSPPDTPMTADIGLLARVLDHYRAGIASGPADRRSP